MDRKEKLITILILTLIFGSFAVFFIYSVLKVENSYTSMTEPIEMLEFKNSKSEGDITLITTEKQTIAFKRTEFVESDDGIDKVSYEINHSKAKNGEVRNAKVFLAPESIKKYSKSYAEVYGDTMIVSK